MVVMCLFLSSTSKLETCRHYLSIPDTGVSFSEGVSSEVFDANHQVFRIPYATVFTMSLSHQSAQVWSGVFAFDLLRRPRTQWSPVQEASRFMCDVIRPIETNADRHWGGIFVKGLLTMVAPDALEIAKKIEALLGNVGQPNWEKNFDRCSARYRELENSKLFRTRIDEMSTASVPDVIARPPSEFHVYSTFTLTHDKYDYRGCADSFLVRIVSRATANHNLILDLRPRFTGLTVPSDEELARWLPGYLQRKLSTRPCKSNPTVLTDRWKRSIWTELTGKPEAEHQLDAWGSKDPADVPLTIIMGRESATGMRVPTIETNYAEVFHLKVFGSLVEFRTYERWGRFPEVPIDVEIGCASNADARSLLGSLTYRELRRIGRSKLVRTISAYYGPPQNYATLAGFSHEEQKHKIREFTTRHAPRQIHVDRLPSRLFLHVASQ